MRDEFWIGPRWRRWVVGLSLGVVAALGQAPVGWPLATLLAFSAVFWLAVAAPNRRRAAVFGWLFATGHFLLALSWIVEPFLVDIARHGWMAPFALFFMAGGLALFWAAAFAAGLGGGALGLAAALGLAELGRAYLLTGFPWAQPGHGWIDTPVAQLAQIGGALGLTALTLGIASLPALRLSRPLRIASAAGALAVVWLGGMALDRSAPVPAADAPVVRIVQPNAPQDEKWVPGRAEMFFDRALGFTAEGAAPDLVVWPETSVPWFLSEAAPELALIAEAARGAPAIVGIQRSEWPRFWNSLAVVAPDGSVADVYDKSHLVPFGEYVPFAGLLGRFGIHGLAANEGGGFTAGPGGRTVEIPGLGPALPLICYEGIFAEEVRAVSPRAGLMVLITNDAWFGEVSGPYQHLVQARFRSIEMGLPMVRAANTGVSAVIDARGGLVTAIPLGEAGWRDAPLPSALAPPLYARLGDLPLLGLLLLGFAATLVRVRRRHD
ncbi:apolipoprotein N-acyltransferase [Histidinibacterium lentulum]|uniref:Apolipoprotein N-acyltransferase n=1 Tax=Histidinibacterium lentulum TaxID=2480588 RepID=A0A3N2R8B3_9RHOB|nr:apolipoprotein N-acyltransferase [Histidinibacterium lentulum]ROU03566.1 apolipoprotein N-acyltransferase [Histidinibacterium lentulum]